GPRRHGDHSPPASGSDHAARAGDRAERRRDRGDDEAAEDTGRRPLSHEAARARRRARHRPRVPSGRRGGGGRMTRADGTWARIVVVDDQAANVTLLERMLEQWGYTRVIGTTDSSSVADICASSPPDLLLFDLQMPKPDGFELMEIMRPLTQGPPSVPVLVLTADITTE